MLWAWQKKLNSERNRGPLSDCITSGHPNSVNQASRCESTCLVAVLESLAAHAYPLYQSTMAIQSFPAAAKRSKLTHRIGWTASEGEAGGNSFCLASDGRAC